MRISVLIALLAVQCANTYEPWNFNGTTPSLKAIFLGRCAQYQELNVANKLPSLFENVNCLEMWELFTKAFKNKTQCVSNITEQSYGDYFSKLNSSRKLVNKVFAWFYDLLYICFILFCHILSNCEQVISSCIHTHPLKC